MKKCFVYSHDIISRSSTNQMLEDNGHFLIIKEIPCLVCENCGEIYFETEVMIKLENLIKQNISELEVINYQQVA